MLNLAVKFYTSAMECLRNCISKSKDHLQDYSAIIAFIGTSLCVEVSITPNMLEFRALANLTSMEREIIFLEAAF